MQFAASLKRKSLILFIGLMLVGQIVPGTSVSGEQLAKQKQRSITELEKEFSMLDQWKERRAFCIELIDQGIIARGCPVEDLKKIFKERFVVMTGNVEEACRATILFEDQSSDGARDDDTRAKGFYGWYLRVESDKNGAVTEYYISNLHK